MRTRIRCLFCLGRARVDRGPRRASAVGGGRAVARRRRSRPGPASRRRAPPRRGAVSVPFSSRAPSITTEVAYPNQCSLRQTRNEMNFAWRSSKLSGRPMASQNAIGAERDGERRAEPDSDPTATARRSRAAAPSRARRSATSPSEPEDRGTRLPARPGGRRGGDEDAPDHDPGEAPNATNALARASDQSSISSSPRRAALCVEGTLESSADDEEEESLPTTSSSSIRRGVAAESKTLESSPVDPDDPVDAVSDETALCVTAVAEAVDEEASATPSNATSARRVPPAWRFLSRSVCGGSRSWPQL